MQLPDRENQTYLGHMDDVRWLHLNHYGVTAGLHYLVL